MKLDPNRANRIAAAARGVILALIAVAISFGFAEAKATALGAVAVGLVSLVAAVFVRSGLAPQENTSGDEVPEEVTDDHYEDPKVGLSE